MIDNFSRECGTTLESFNQEMFFATVLQLFYQRMKIKYPDCKTDYEGEAKRRGDTVRPCNNVEYGYPISKVTVCLDRGIIAKIPMGMDAGDVADKLWERFCYSFKGTLIDAYVGITYRESRNMSEYVDCQMFFNLTSKHAEKPGYTIEAGRERAKKKATIRRRRALYR